MKSPLGAILVRTGVTGETGSQTGKRGNGDERRGIGERCSEWLPAGGPLSGPRLVIRRHQMQAACNLAWLASGVFVSPGRRRRPAVHTPFVPASPFPRL